MRSHRKVQVSSRYFKLQGVQKILGKRLKEAFWHLKHAPILSHGSWQFSLFRQAPDFRDGLVTAAKYNDLALLEAVQILGKVGFRLVDIQMNHSFILSPELN